MISIINNVAVTGSGANATGADAIVDNGVGHGNPPTVELEIIGYLIVCQQELMIRMIYL